MIGRSPAGMATLISCAALWRTVYNTGMSFFKKIASLFSPPASSAKPASQDASACWVAVRCNRCGETLRARVDLQHDLSIEYGESATTYFCRKVLIGEGHCFQRVEVELTFDSDRRLINREISGGQFVEE
jgi:hypothetical protein